MRPWGSPGDSREPGGALPFNIDAAVVGTDIRGDRMSGAPNGVAAVRRGVVARPGMAGDKSRCVSAAAAATRLHSSSQAEQYLCQDLWLLEQENFTYQLLMLLWYLNPCRYRL